MPMTPKQMIKLLKSNGFIEVRQEGSHKFMVNETTNKRTTVPMHSKDFYTSIIIRNITYVNRWDER